MVVKVYISGISASKEVKKRQQRALLILDSAKVDYDPIDITEPGREDEREQVQPKWKTRNGNLNPLPPQFFNNDDYLGDYDDFSTAVDIDDIFAFLRLEDRKEEIRNEIIKPPVNNQKLITNGDGQGRNDINENEDNEIAETRGEIVSEKTEVIGEYETRQTFKVDDDGKVQELVPEEVKDEVEVPEPEEVEEPQQQEQPKVTESSSEEEEEEEESE
ncbi:hypothetical protein CHUAL_012049 [Chamberlinius hualienensis]